MFGISKTPGFGQEFVVTAEVTPGNPLTFIIFARDY